MGSRGQFIKTGKFENFAYHTIMRYENVRFVLQNDTVKSTKIPEMSNSPNAVYATLNKEGLLQGISFYDEKRIKRREIDFKNHKGMNPHVHTLNPKTGIRDDSLVDVRDPNAEEERYIKRILELCNKYNLYEKAKRKHK